MGNPASRQRQKPSLWEADGRGRHKCQFTIALTHAILKKDLHTAREFLSLIPNGQIDSKDGVGITPLHVTAEYGSAELMEVLLKMGANPNVSDDCQLRPIHYAAKSGFIDCVELLWRTEKLDLDCVDAWERTPLHKAVIYHHDSTARILIRYGCNVNIPDQQKRLPIHAAASYGNLSLVKDLIKSGSRIDWQDAGGRTPMHFAILGQHEEVVKYLIAENCDIELQTRGSPHGPKLLTALALAAEKGCYRIVKILLESGAKVVVGKGGQLDTESGTLTHLIQFVTQYQLNAKVQSLNHMCRRVIRKFMTESQNNMVYALNQAEGLPTYLRKYLLFEIL